MSNFETTKKAWSEFLDSNESVYRCGQLLQDILEDFVESLSVARNKWAEYIKAREDRGTYCIWYNEKVSDSVNNKDIKKDFVKHITICKSYPEVKRERKARRKETSS